MNNNSSDESLRATVRAAALEAWQRCGGIGPNGQDIIDVMADAALVAVREWLRKRAVMQMQSCDLAGEVASLHAFYSRYLAQVTPAASPCTECGMKPCLVGEIVCGDCLTPAPSPSVQCTRCNAPATREFCYAAEPWLPYCDQHRPQYETAGERPLIAAPVPVSPADLSVGASHAAQPGAPKEQPKERGQSWRDVGHADVFQMPASGQFPEDQHRQAHDPRLPLLQARMVAAPSPEPQERITCYTPMLWAVLTEDQRYEEYVRVRQALVDHCVQCPQCHAAWLTPEAPSAPVEPQGWRSTDMKGMIRCACGALNDATNRRTPPQEPAHGEEHRGSVAETSGAASEGGPHDRAEPAAVDARDGVRQPALSNQEARPEAGRVVEVATPPAGSRERINKAGGAALNAIKDGEDYDYQDFHAAACEVLTILGERMRAAPGYGGARNVLAEIDDLKAELSPSGETR